MIWGAVGIFGLVMASIFAVALSAANNGLGDEMEM